MNERLESSPINYKACYWAGRLASSHSKKKVDQPFTLRQPFNSFSHAKPVPTVYTAQQMDRINNHYGHKIKSYLLSCTTAMLIWGRGRTQRNWLTHQGQAQNAKLRNPILAALIINTRSSSLPNFQANRIRKTTTYHSANCRSIWLKYISTFPNGPEKTWWLQFSQTPSTYHWHFWDWSELNSLKATSHRFRDKAWLNALVSFIMATVNHRKMGTNTKAEYVHIGSTGVVKRLQTPP